MGNQHALTTDQLAERRFNVACGVFRRKGGRTNRTALFADLPLPLRESLESRAPLIPGERPVLGCFVGPEAWFVGTTVRIIHGSAEHSESCYFHTLRQVGDLGFIRQLQVSRESLVTLNLHLKDGRCGAMKLERGSSALAVLAVIRFLARV